MRPRSLLPRVLVLAALSGLLITPVSARPAAPQTRAPTPVGALTTGQVTVTHVTSGLVQPLGVVNAGDGTDRLFVVEQRGTVRVVSGGVLQDGFFLDIRLIEGGLSTESERGLTGIAFHPDFETNRILFAYYTDGDQGPDLGGDVTITQLEANADGTAVDVATADPILEIEHSDNNIHVGGQMLFDPDGHLYAFTGDIGVHGDPDQSAQNLDLLVGKTLRITPDLNGGYTIPADNPFVGPIAGADEIWARGLRNPWRASFDRQTGDLWTADVGNSSWEEVNREPADSPGGRNYGWSLCEGSHALPGPGPCTAAGVTGPHLEYPHDPQKCAVVGGFVYRGAIFPDLAGQYVLGDFCSGELWTADAGAVTPALVEHRDTSIRITSFGESESGELYMTDRRGALYRVVAPPYTDVADHSLLDHIMWLTNEGISSGCGGGLYCPNASVSRAQMAAFLARALDLPATGTDFFTDDDGHPLEVSINRVAEAGITTGCAADSYCPSAPVTRAEMASFLDRAFGFPPTGNDYFSDDEGSTHENAINRLREANVTSGCTPATYCPQASTTRAQMAAFLHRASGD
jgi:glucose/arabinose dehydrogenase